MTRFSQDALRMIALLVVVIWAVFLLDRLVPLERFGLFPRSVHGLAGIVAMPFLHQDLAHLVANTVPLVILLAMLALSTDRPWLTAAAVALAGGLLLWLFGRSANHIGASGLVFGLAAYLVASAWYTRTVVSLAVAAATLFFYGGVLFSGMLPAGAHVSWDGHIAGAAGGIAVAALRRSRRRTGH